MLTANPTDGSACLPPPPRGADLYAALVARLRDDVARHWPGHGELTCTRGEERPYSRIWWLTARGVDSAPIRLVAKSLKPKPLDGGVAKMQRRVAHEFDTTSRVYAAMRADDVLDVVRPVACYPDLLAIVTEESRGHTLLEHLERHAVGWPKPRTRDALADTIARISRWLRAFQRIEPPEGESGSDDLREYIDLRLRRFEAEAPRELGDGGRDRVLQHVEALIASCAAGDLDRVITHSDFAPGNILIDNDHVIVLDFAMAGRGTRLHDLTRLYLQMELLSAKPWFLRAIIAPLQAALLRSFDPALTEQAPLFRLQVLLHRINNLLSVTTRRGRLASRLVDARVRSLHRAALEAELTAPIDRRGART